MGNISTWMDDRLSALLDGFVARTGRLKPLLALFYLHIQQ